MSIDHLGAEAQNLARRSGVSRKPAAAQRQCRESQLAGTLGERAAFQTDNGYRTAFGGLPLRQAKNELLHAADRETADDVHYAQRFAAIRFAWWVLRAQDSGLVGSILKERHFS